MLEFLILVGIAGLLLAKSIAGLVLGRFPSGADLAQVSTFYYSVPLATLAYLQVDLRQMTFLNVIASDAQLAIISLRYVCLAMLSIEIGRYLSRSAGASEIKYTFVVNEALVLRAGIFILLAFLVFPLGIYIFGLEFFLEGYATESLNSEADLGTALIYSAVQALGVGLAFLMIVRLHTGRLPLKPLFWGSLIILILILFVRVKRLEVLTALIPVAIILFANRSRAKATVLRVVNGVLLLTGLAIISAVRVSEQLGFETLAFYFLSEGVYAGHSLPGIIHRIDVNLTGYEYGARFLNAVLAFIPSFFWPSKIEVVYGPDLIFEGISPLGATTLLTEIILQGGAVAVFLFYVGLGASFERLERFQEHWEEAKRSGQFPLRFGIYLIAISIFVPHFRDGIIPALKLFMQSAAFFFAVAWIHRAKPWQSIVLDQPRGNVAVPRS